MGCGFGYIGDLCDKGLIGLIVFLRKYWYLKKNLIIGKFKI